MPNCEEITNIINQISNIQLAILGITITVFTVLYAFIMTKKDELKILSNQIKIGDKSPLVLQKTNFVARNIIKLKKINDKVVYVILFSFVFFSYTWIVSLFKILINNKNFLFIIIALVIEFALLTLLLIKIFLNYKKETKI
jgi:Cft2 family RNA processing exonuclease